MSDQWNTIIDELLAEPCKHNHNIIFSKFNQRFQYICARDLGIFGSLPILTAILFLGQSWMGHHVLSYSRSLLVSFLTTLPLVIDWWLQCSGILHSTNFRRLMTGSITGLGVSLLLLYPSFYWISLPLMLLWGWLINKIGHNMVMKRSAEWGCKNCRSA